MPTQPMHPKEHLRRKRAVEKALRGGATPRGHQSMRGETGAVAAAAQALGMSRTSLDSWCSKVQGAVGVEPDWNLWPGRDPKMDALAGELGYKPVLPGFEIKQTSSKEFDGTWVKQVREHGDRFQVPAGQMVKGVSALVDEDGREILKWVKTKGDESIPDLVQALKASFQEDRGKSVLVDPPAACNDNLLSVYPIADQHNGLLAWGRVAGESYDLKIGGKRLRDCASRLVSQSPASKHAIILNLGDWQHTDDSRNETPAHHHALDVDSRYDKISLMGVHLMRDVIEMALAKHERVIVRNLPGNHDPHSCRVLTVGLSMFYENNPRVIVVDDPSEHFYFRFGQTLLGAHHGHRRKFQDLVTAMSTNYRQDWGQTQHHWILTGHIHHETAKEVGDCRVESFRTIASNDAHHANSAYCAGKSLVAITLEREEGEIGRHKINVTPPVQRAVRLADAA